MAKQFGYWIDLQGLRFDDQSTGATWIHAMSVGHFEHPSYGTIDFTPSRIKSFADSVTRRVRGIDLDIDYDHKERSGEAAGWVKQAEARSDGLWLFVEWTKSAWQKIQNKEYRYFSPEFVDEWEHPQGEKFTDVLFGGALTNRPFLKNLVPINFAELVGGAQQENQGGGSMTPEEALAAQAELLGLPKEATAEEISTATQTLKSANDAYTAAADKGGDQGSGEGSQQLPIAASESSAELKKLAETNPLVATLLAERQEEKQLLAELTVEVRTQTAKRKLSEINTEKVILSPVAKELAEKVLLKASTQLSEDILELIRTFADGKGVVQLGEKGTTGASEQEREASEDSIKSFTDKIDKLMLADPKLDYATAVGRVSQSEPEAFEAYRQASMAFREN